MAHVIHRSSGDIWSYRIDYDAREIDTMLLGEKCVTPFNAAFSKAMDSYMAVEDRIPPIAKHMLYLNAYQRYLSNAPTYH